MKELKHIASEFQIEGKIEKIEPLGEGFINDTYRVIMVGDCSNYILQRKNHQIFKDVPAMMQNIQLVTSHLKEKVIQRAGDPL